MTRRCEPSILMVNSSGFRSRTGRPLSSSTERSIEVSSTDERNTGCARSTAPEITVAASAAAAQRRVLI